MVDAAGVTPRWWQAVVGLGVGAVVLLALAGTCWQAATDGGADVVATAPLWGVGVAGLAWRRRRPGAVAAGELVIALATTALGPGTHGSGAVLLPVALYAVAVAGPPLRAIAGAVASALLLTAAAAAVARDATDLAPLVPEVALITAAVAVGLAVGSQRALLATYRERAEQAEREQRLTASQAVADERVRLARELHDVVAHHVSLLVVQAGAVREVLPADHATRPLLDSMIDGGRTAMAELRQMLGPLRVEGAPRAPQPGLEEVGDLVAGAAAAGLPVRLEVHGAAGPVPAAASLSAYRIVQEALTNVVRHAPGAPTSVVVEHRPEAVVVLVRNDPSPASAPGRGAAGAGHGLLGMRERAAQAGGALDAGPAAGGGWEVRATLPLEAGLAPLRR